MRKLLVIPLILLLASCAGMRDLTRTESDTGLGSDPFSTGGSFTAAQANAINNAIDDNDDRLDTIEAIDGPVISSGDGTYTSPTDGIQDTHINFGTGAGQVSAADIPVATTNFDEILSTESDVQAAIEALEEAFLIDLSGLADLSWSGKKTDLTAGEEITTSEFGWPFYIDDDGKAYIYKSGSTYTDNQNRGPKGILLPTDTVAAEGTIEVGIGFGVLRSDTDLVITGSQDEGLDIYVYETGGWSVTAPTGNDDHVIPGGFVISATPDIIFVHDLGSVLDFTITTD